MTIPPKRKTKSKSRTKVQPHSLKSGRPPLSTHGQQPILSSRATRNLIRGHHTLQKRLSAARSAKDESLVTELEAQLTANGGLQSYQLASTLGQSVSRGGDTSRILVEWLEFSGQSSAEKRHNVRILEVGALSTANALNVPGITVKRIDLRSQEDGIEEIDFMDLPQPSSLENEGFDILSLSLVLNFVPEPRSRGDMLRRTSKFLRPAPSNEASSGRLTSRSLKPGLLPALFLVLPLPCVSNSRYLDEHRLAAIMQSLNYSLSRVKKSSKLYYSLWTYHSSSVQSYDKEVREEPEDGERGTRRTIFRKEEVRSGKDRNNFCIVLE